MACKTYYPVCSPIRILLIISFILLISPFVFSELYNIIYVPILYFFSSYFIFLNFPYAIESLQSKPLYIEDLILENKENSFKYVYNILMSFILALIVAGIAEYIFLQGIDDKPISEVLAILWGNISLFIKIQDVIGKIMVNLCFTIKNNEKIQNIVKRISSSNDTQINIVDIEINKI
jgi:hypothetical protein